MTNRRLVVSLPILIIAVGVGWLLIDQQVSPQINWVWLLGLATAGLLTFVIGGFNKVTFVLGPMLLLETFLYLRRTDEKITFDTEVPVLVIAFGVLLLLAVVLPVPAPPWLVEADEAAREQES